MKGIVFTEFLDYVGEAFGTDVVDDILEDAALVHGGAYTAVGTYPYAEMGALVGALATRVGIPVPVLLERFGSALCRRFAVQFPEFFPAGIGLFGFLASVDNHIHVEVHKLYPDAELPTFALTARGPDAVDFDYDSCRPLEALAEGMIRAASEHFSEPVVIEKSRFEDRDRKLVRFAIRRAAAQLAA